MEGVMGLITGRERRRRWSAADKLRIVAESQEPGALIRAVAARHGVCESLVFTWRRQVRDGVLVRRRCRSSCRCRCSRRRGRLRPRSRSPSSHPAPSARPSSGLIEIELGNGHQVRVGSDVNLAALRRVLAALRG
jgi:transposase